MNTSIISTATTMNKGFQYTVAPHPTNYAGVRFRSRLEATWAAFFDIIKVRWEYEPFDLDGWTPDFLLHVGPNEILVEVKPVSDPRASESRGIFEKARRLNTQYWVLLLGRAPLVHSVGCLCDRPLGADLIAWCDAHEMTTPEGHLTAWTQANNLLRWKGPRS